MPPPRSVIWNYFDTWLQDDSKLGKCNACNKTIKCGAGSTSGLKQHLRTHHLEIYYEYCRFRDEGKLARDMDAQKKDNRVYEPQYDSNEDPKNGHVLLSGNDFGNDTKHAFKDLLEDEHFTNVTLVTDGNKQIKAHKVILSAFSPFFRELLVNNPHQHPLVYLYGIAWADLEAVVEFLYLGEASVKENSLKGFLDISEKLKIVGINIPKESEIVPNKSKHDQLRKPKTPDLVKSTRIKVPVEEIRKERKLLSKFDNIQKHAEGYNNEIDKDNFQNDNLKPPVASGYYTGYYTTASNKPIADIKDKNSQKESLENLKQSFDSYDNNKACRSNAHYETDRQKGGLKSGQEKLNCDECRYQAISKDEIRMHRMAFHSKY